MSVNGPPWRAGHERPARDQRHVVDLSPRLCEWALQTAVGKEVVRAAEGSGRTTPEPEPVAVV